MEEACWPKFSQNEWMKDYLLGTGKKRLAEASPYDARWGIGMSEEDAMHLQEADWPGENWLGIVLERVRDRLLLQGEEAEDEHGDGDAAGPTPLARASSDEYGKGASAYTEEGMVEWKRIAVSAESAFKGRDWQQAEQLGQRLCDIRPDFVKGYMLRYKAMAALQRENGAIEDMLREGIAACSETNPDCSKLVQALELTVSCTANSVSGVGGGGEAGAGSTTKGAPDPSADESSGSTTKGGGRKQAKVNSNAPKMLVLVGCPGCGKSTFAAALAASHSSYVICSQDDAGGSRRVVEDMVSRNGKRLGQGTRIILDRVNPTVDDRVSMLQLVFMPPDAVAVFFDIDATLCETRVANRVGHPTIPYGKGKGAVKSMSRQLQVPVVGGKEGFAAVHTVRNPDDAAALLASWGAEPPEVQPMGYFKFPRTHHISNTGNIERDDLLLDKADAARFWGPGRVVRCEEKIDGSNLGFSLSVNWEVQVQNRAKYICSASASQYKALDSWIEQHQGELCQILGEPERFILFGEWMYAQHSIRYTKLPGYFIAFDIFDKGTGKFLSKAARDARLDGSTIPLIPTVAEREFSDLNELLGLLNTQSQFYDGFLEGVYVKVDDGEHCAYRGKLVRKDFIQEIEDHWMTKELVRNTLDY
jgi:hypothetical protein